MFRSHAGALTIGIGLWGIIYYTYNSEPQKNNIGNYLGPSSAGRKMFDCRGKLGGLGVEAVAFCSNLGNLMSNAQMPLWLEM